MSDKYFVISRIVDDGVLKGFMIIDELGSSKPKPISLDIIASKGDSIKYSNATYSSSFKTLVGTYLSLTKYPETDSKFSCIKNNGVVAISIIVDAESGKEVGVLCSNGYGNLSSLSFNDFNNLCKKYKPINFKVVNNSILFLDDTPLPRVTKKSNKTSLNKSLTYSSSKGESVSKDVKVTMPEIPMYSLDSTLSSEFAKPAQEKLLLALMNLQKLSPYYHCCLQALRRVPSKDLGTMGVTEDTLYYDLSFVATCSVAELTFILIHEISHVAMQHPSRGRMKNHDLFNIACDLYINSIICRDFDLSLGEVREFSNGAVIIAPIGGCYVEFFNEVLDFSKDTPETIYSRLLKENDNSFSQQSNGGTSQNNGQNSMQSDSSSGDSQQEDDTTGSSSGDNARNSSENNQQNNGGTDNTTSGNSSDNSVSQAQEDSKITVTFNGRKVEFDRKNISDLYTNDSSNSTEGNEASMDKSKSALQRIKTKVERTEEKLGESLSKNAGDGAGLMQRYIDYGLALSLNWRVLLKNMLKQDRKKMFTLGNPNRDYMNMGMTVAGRQKVGKPQKVSGVKICVDVSGSVSESELRLYLSEIAGLFLHYKVDGELIYWSTEVGEVGNITNINDLLKVNPISTGGTDVSCIFDYLMHKSSSASGKLETTKPKDITGIFIITDGCFSHNYGQYSYLDKKVVWLIKGNVVGFNPLFGRVVDFNN